MRTSSSTIPHAVPFEWTKRQVRPVEPKHKHAYLNN